MSRGSHANVRSTPRCDCNLLWMHGVTLPAEIRGGGRTAGNPISTSGVAAGSEDEADRADERQAISNARNHAHHHRVCRDYAASIVDLWSSLSSRQAVCSCLRSLCMAAQWVCRG